MAKNKQKELVMAEADEAEVVVASYDRITYEGKKFDKDHSKLDYCNYFINMAAIYVSNNFSRTLAKALKKPQVSVKRFGLSESTIDMCELSMANDASKAGVKLLDSGGARVTIPLMNNFTFITSNYTDSLYTYWADDSVIAGKDREIFFEVMEKLFGPDLWDGDKSVVWSIDPEPALFAGTDPEGYLTADLIDEDPKFSAKMIDALQAVHIVAMPIENTQIKIRSLKEAEKAGNDLLAFKGLMLSRRSFMVMGEVELLPKYVQHATQSKRPNIIHLHQFVASCVAATGKGEDAPKRFNPVQNIKEHNIGQKPIRNLTDANRLAIDENGAPIYIPEADNVIEYDTLYKRTGLDGGVLGWSIDSPMRPYEIQSELSKDKVVNRLIYTDDVHRRLVYSAKTEPVVAKDLSRSVAAKPYHVSALLSRTMGAEDGETTEGDRLVDLFDYYVKKSDSLNKIEKWVNPDDFSALINRSAVPATSITMFANTSYRGDRESGEELKRNIADTIRRYGLTGYLEEVSRVLMVINSFHNRRADINDNYDVPKEDIWAWSSQGKKSTGPAPLTLRDLTTDSNVKFLRIAGQIVRSVAKEMLMDPKANIEMRDVANGISAMGFAVIIDRYMSDMKKLDKDTEAHQKSLANTGLPKADWKAPSLAGILPGKKFLPHQGKVEQRLVNNPPLVMLSVDPGGGKTFIALSEAVKRVQDGLTKKPLVGCPSYLVSQYFDDAIKQYGANWNLIALTRSTIMEHGWERLERMVVDAPPNTIFITDFNFNKGNDYKLAYGIEEIQISVNNKRLIDLEFDAVFVDESHFAKNEFSLITKCLNALVNTIPTIYVMSGTMIDGTLNDIVAQARLCDPTIFGSMKQFLSNYAEIYSGNRVIRWKDGAQKKIRDLLESRVCFVNVKQKEWGALLPTESEKFHVCYQTTEQENVYRDLLTSVLEEIRSNKKLMDKIKRMEEAGDAEFMMNLESQLNPYLAKLEQFVTDPVFHQIGKDMLEGDDMISSKVRKISEIVDEHFKKGIKGKILIYTRYHSSADAIYENLPKNIRKKTLRYHSNQKSKHKAMFLKDDSIQVMVGVSTSLVTGHNFQNTSRVIRVEGEWNPGANQQGLDRIFRPDVENKYGISKKYIDWVVTDKTIDITKMARLISKILSKVSFDEADNKNYRDLPQRDVVPMTLDSIADSNGYYDTLEPYIKAYAVYKGMRDKDFEEFKNNKQNLREMFPIPQGDIKKMIKGAARMIDAPYVENAPVPFAEELGLMSLVEYASDQKMDASEITLKDMYIHTEWGDGQVIGASGSTFKVQIGRDRLNVSKLKSFVFLDQDAARKRIKKDPYGTREQIGKLAALPLRTIDTAASHDAISEIDEQTMEPVDNDAYESMVSLPDARKDDKEKKEKKPAKEKRPTPAEPKSKQRRDEKLEVFAVAVNNQIGVAVSVDDPDAVAEDMAEQGFQLIPRNRYAKINSPATFNALKKTVDKMVKKKEIVLTPGMQRQFDQIAGLMAKGMSQAKTIKRATQQDLRDYRLDRAKKAKDPNTVHLSWLVEDDELYAVVTWDLAPHGKQFLKEQIRGVQWKKDSGYYVKFFKTKPKAAKFVDELGERVAKKVRKSFTAELESLSVIG